MAKKRLKIKDKQGNVVDYDISSASVTIDIEGKSLDVKLSEIATALLQAVTEVTFNGTPYNRENGKINLGQQMQADWNENNTNWPAYIRNKPNSVVNEMLYDQQSRKVRQRRNGVVEDVFTLPEEGSQVTFDEQMSSTSENGVQNKVIKAYVDAVSQRIDTLLGSGNVQGAIDTFNEVVAFLNGINSSDTLAAKLLLKANTADVYTKTEIDDKVANAGKVMSVSVNGTNHEPNSSGVVDLGTIQGQKGDKGEKGDTVVIDPEGLEQFTIANDLDTSDATMALSARQGKILKQAISTVQANLQAMVDALANMAFTTAKPTLTQIDWTGGTFYATVVKNLTGCTATDNTTNGQIAEGQTLTMQLTASSGHTLTGATISVTDSRGQAVAYTLNGNTLSVANVTGTITVSVVAVGVYSVANNDTHATLSNSTPANPTHGGSWSGTLSAASGYGLSATPSVTMGGVAVDFTASGNSWNRNTGAMTIGNVTGNIVILEAAVEVVAHTVTKKLLNMTSSNTTGDTTDADFGYKMQSVEDGDSYSTTLTAVSGATSNNDVVVKMGGVDITSSAYNSSTGVVSIAEVTGDVTIIATAATGVIKVTSNAAVTAGLTISGTTISGTTITNKAIDLVNGELTLEDAMQTITKFSLISDAKAAVTALDFGGAKITILENVFGAIAAANACTELTSLKGLVVNQLASNGGQRKMDYAFHGCSKLEVLETIGWTSEVTPISFAFKGIKVTALDIEDLNVTATSFNQTFNGCSNLLRCKLPFLPTITNFTNAFGSSGIQRISINAGNSITTFNGMFSSCANLSFVDFSGTEITSALTDISFFMNGAGSNITLKIGSFDLSGVNTATVHKMDKVTTLICTTSTPQNSAMFTYLTALTAIYVPDAAVENYKSAWSEKASIIHSINEYTE